MMLKLKKISKHFGGNKAVHNCSFSIKQGEITGIIGPNGSGKTTTFNTITKLYKPNHGHLYLNGKEITKSPTHQITKTQISRTFQEVRLFPYLTIREHLEIALSKNDHSIIKSLFKPEKISPSKIKNILKLVGLDKPINTLATDLSYGQRKLLDLAIAIAKPHKLLMLDEPVAGINPALRNEIKQIIKNLNKKGETILIIEHDMNFLMDIADFVVVMDAGAVIAEGKPKEIQKNKKVLEAYLGN